MINGKKRIVWFCGLPEKTRMEAFPDLGLPSGAAWSWVLGHLPPPPHIDLHIVCANRHLKEDVTREWGGAVFHLLKVPRGGPYFMYEGWIPAFVRKSRELSPDVIHGWGTENVFGLAALRAAPNNHLIGIQGILLAYLPVMKKTLALLLSTINEWRVLRKAQRCVAESEYSRITASKYTHAQFSVIPHPLRPEFRTAAFGTKNEKLILYLGTLSRRKGFFDAVEAFMALDSDWKLICIGNVGGGEKCQNEVDRILKETAAGDRIQVVGAQNPTQIIEWFQRSPVFLLPSYMDTGPTALKEALAMGLWPVCYNNTGPQELIKQYGVGSLVPTGNKSALREALKLVLDEKPWRDTSRMESVAEKIRCDLSPQSVWKTLEDVYSSYVDSSQPH